MDMVTRGRSGIAKLTAHDAMEIVRRRSNGLSTATLATMFGVSRVSIQNVLKGTTWSHATGITKDLK